MARLALVPALALFLALTPPSRAAETTGPRLRLYVDCTGASCDFDGLRQRLDSVDWVRDRMDADVYVLITTRPAAGGGTERTMFVSRPPGSGGPAADTLRLDFDVTMSDADARDRLASALAAIVARDLVGRPGGGGVRVTFEPAGATAPEAVAARDPWNAWVMRAGIDGSLNGESAYRSSTFNGYLSASRVTEGSKLGFDASGNRSENRYTFGDGTILSSVNRGWGVTARAVLSVGGRWSAGGRVFASGASFANLDWQAGAGPALEFDVFPYAESSRRSFTFAYSISRRHSEYLEVTLYGKTAESLTQHSVSANLGLAQPWGSVSAKVALAQYLHDASARHASVSGSVDLRMIRGFSLQISGYGARLHDALAIPRGDASNDDVLARRRQIQTSFEYWATFGVSYTFGSIFNGIVNQRLDSAYGPF